MHWKNKTVIITGANTGIGKAAKILLRRKGCLVFNLDLELLPDEDTDYFIICDVRKS